MALTARLAPALLVAALAAGCNQSLFDADGDDDPAVSADASGEPDSAPARPDARVVEPDAAMPPPDGGLPDNCPPPCAGNVLLDFDGSPAGSNDRWSYVEVLPATADYGGTTIANLGGTLGWVGTGTPAPAIGFCFLPKDMLPCGDLEPAVVLVTTNNAGANHPALRWTAPMDGTYQLSGTWSFPSQATVVENSLLLTRNGQSEVLLSISTSDAARMFDTTVMLAADDIITLTAVAQESTGMPVGVNFYVTGPLSTQSYPTAVERNGSFPAGLQGVQP